MEPGTNPAGHGADGGTVGAFNERRTMTQTNRDRIAEKAMKSIIANDLLYCAMEAAAKESGRTVVDVVAVHAYRHADSMLAEKARREAE